MNWRKWIKYALVFLAITTSVAIYWFYRQGKQIYGGLTQQVDHERFEPQHGSFAITNVNILSPDGEKMIAEQTVLIEQGVITAIDSVLSLQEQNTIIDGKGKYLIPGLIDAHVHLFQSPNDLLLYLANGVTEIRELIGEKSHLKWKQEIESGRIGPQMFVASPRLGSFDNMEGWFMSQTQGYINIQDAGEARVTVNDLYQQGYDGLKIYSQLNKESYLALTETAKSLGMPYFGHIPWELELSEVWEHGQSGIAHFEELMNALQREFDPAHDQKFGSFYGKEEAFLEFVDQRSQDIADNLIKSDIAVTSSLWLTESFVRQKFELEKVLKEVELEYQNPGISEWVSYIPGGLGWLPEVNRYQMSEGFSDEKRASHKKYWATYGKACSVLAANLADMGVTIMAGTDANLPPAVPGFSLHDELGSLQKAGMSPSQVLRSATSIPASWLKSHSGKILPGYSANLVLLENNPLDDIAHTRTINTVISRGQVFDRDLLDEILAAVKEANDASRKINIDKYK